jgi:hypothetical protein
MNKIIMTKIIDNFNSVSFSFFPDFKLNDGASILLNPGTCFEKIIVGHQGDIYHPDNSSG